VRAPIQSRKSPSKGIVRKKRELKKKKDSPRGKKEVQMRTRLMALGFGPGSP